MMKLIWNGHSCFTVVLADGTLVLDPYRDGSVPGYAPLKLSAGTVLCSHGHRDHAATEVVELTDGAPKVEIEEIHTFHDPEGGALRGEDIIHIISADGLRIAHCGDLGCELEPEQKEKLKSLDALLIPIGGHYTIDAQQAKALVDEVKPRVVIPMHYRYDGFGYDVLARLEDFLELCDNVVRYEGNFLELTQETTAQTAVLSY